LRRYRHGDGVDTILEHEQLGINRELWILIDFVLELEFVIKSGQYLALPNGTRFMIRPVK